MTTRRHALDDAKVKAFIQRMVTHLTGAAVTLMLDIGRQTGLFETNDHRHRRDPRPDRSGGVLRRIRAADLPGQAPSEPKGQV